MNRRPYPGWIGMRGVNGKTLSWYSHREERNIMMRGIHHFSLIASSEKSIDFYTSLGFKEKRRIERGYDTVVLMDGFDAGLEIFIDPRHPKRESAEPLGLRQIALQVDDFWKTVEAFGIEEIKTDWFGKRYIQINDPDGNKVQLCEDRSLEKRQCRSGE